MADWLKEEEAEGGQGGHIDGGHQTGTKRSSMTHVREMRDQEDWKKILNLSKCPNGPRPRATGVT